LKREFTACFQRPATGLTLIELAVTMGILAVLAALAVPAIAARLPDYRLRRAARDLYSCLQYTKMSAVRDNRPWAVVFDPAGGRYMVCSDRGQDNDWRTVGDNAVDQVVMLAGYGSGVCFGHGCAKKAIGGSFGSDHVTYRVPHNNVVQFNGRGTCSSGYVYLQNSRQSAYGVGTRWTGVIRILHWLPASAAWR
jgi:prepilin-type N-terminal cleavage/methylation domain-containing protein